MAGYKVRLRDDLDRWIASGLVAADKRDAILASIPEARRLDAASALAWVGSVLLGIAVITFISANWDGLPKIARFTILCVSFLGLAGIGALAAERSRPMASNIALMIATLVFAAAIGLTGQIFDIASDPQTAFYAAGIAGFVLAFAGRSTGAATVALIFIALADFTGRSWFSNADSGVPWMLLAAPLAGFMSLRWGSAPLAHVSALGILYCFAWFAGRTQVEITTLLLLCALMTTMAAGARWLFTHERKFADIFYGWFAWGALVLLAWAGYAPLSHTNTHNAGIAHRLIWLAASGGVLALGRFDRHMMVSAVGVLSFIGAVCALLMDLGVDLMAAAGVFFLCAVVAMVAGFLLRRKARA